MPGNGLEVEGGGDEVGSGYRIGEGFVLTAGHVVYEWNRSQTNPQFDKNGLTVALDFRHYLDKYDEVVRLLPLPLPPTNHDIDGTPAIAERDSVVIARSGGNIGPGDDGLAWFIDPADLTNTNSSALLNSSMKVVRSDKSGTDNGHITTINPQGLSGVLEFSNDSVGGDSGGAYLLQLAGKEYVLGTHFANLGTTHASALGTYFSGTEWGAINALMESNFTGNITTAEPTNLVVGSSLADTFAGSFRPDRLFGRGGNDTISDGDDPGDTVWANDILIGGDGADKLSAGAGDDVFWGDNENEDSFDDTVKDEANYSASGAAIQMTPIGAMSGHALQVIDGTGGTDTLHAIETVTGSDYNDTLNAGVGRYTLSGGDGNDTFYAHAGNILEGGAGADSFYFSTAEFLTLYQDGEQLVDPATVDLANYNILQTSTFESFLDLRTGTQFPIVTMIAIPKILLKNVDASDKIYIDNVLFNGASRENDSHTFTQLGLYHYTNLDEYDEIFPSFEWAHHDNPGQGFITYFVGSRLIDTTIGTDGQEGYVWDRTSYTLTSALDITISGLAPGGAGVRPQYTVTGTEGDDAAIAGTSDSEGLYGLGGNDHITGGGGDDLIDGGSGIDTAEFVGSSTSQVAYRSLAGIEIWDPSGIEGRDTLLATEFIHFVGDDVTLAIADLPTLGDEDDNEIVGSARPDLLYGYGGADHLIGLGATDLIFGGEGDDELEGGDGNDELDGGEGDDIMYGGAGDDVYYLGARSDPDLGFICNDQVIELANEGVDTAVITTDGNPVYEMPDNLENVTAQMYASGIGIIGNDLDNTIIGGDWVGEYWGSGDWLDGGAGADIMIGRAGCDVYKVDNVGDVVIEEGNDATDYVYTTLSSYSLTDGVEWLEHWGYGSFHGVGNDLDNVIFGSFQSDLLEGGLGNDALVGGGLIEESLADTLIGGMGDDVYDLANNNDIIIEYANEGVDTVITQLQDSYVLPDTVEILLYRGFEGNFTGTGNALNNILLGWSGSTFYGLAGADTLVGAWSDDVLDGGEGDDVLEGGSGNDTLIGGDGEDTAIFSGLSSDYTLATVDGTLFVTHNIVDDPLIEYQGSDSVVGVEALQFADATISLAAPIVLDLDGDGVELLERDQAHAAFDLNGDGIRDRTSWIGADDAFLFLDRDGNGKVSGVAELSFTGDKPNARSDLDGLSAFDSNGDGLLSSLDQGFDGFKLWRDANGDGTASRLETLSLGQVGIRSITLSGSSMSASWDWEQAAILNQGAFTRTNGSLGSFADVALTYEAPTARTVRPEMSLTAPPVLAKPGDRELTDFVQGLRDLYLSAGERVQAAAQQRSSQIEANEEDESGLLSAWSDQQFSRPQIYARQLIEASASFGPGRPSFGMQLLDTINNRQDVSLLARRELQYQE